MKPIDVVSRIYDTMLVGDFDYMASVLAPEVEWFSAENNPSIGSANPLVGLQAIVDELFVPLDQQWENFRCVPQTLLDAGSSVVAEARYTAVLRRNGQGLDAQVCHIWTFRDGLIVKFQQYADTHQLHQLASSD